MPWRIAARGDPRAAPPTRRRHDLSRPIAFPYRDPRRPAAARWRFLLAEYFLEGKRPRCPWTLRTASLQQTCSREVCLRRRWRVISSTGREASQGVRGSLGDRALPNGKIHDDREVVGVDRLADHAIVDRDAVGIQHVVEWNAHEPHVFRPAGLMSEPLHAVF